MRDLSDDLTQEMNKLKQMGTMAKQNWKGPASDTYQKQIMALISKMSHTKNRMTELAAMIDRAAERIKQEDDAAAVRAAKLVTGNGR